MSRSTTAELWARRVRYGSGAATAALVDRRRAEIAAATQLFTEPYMVRFLLQNTLGAWWLSLHPDSPLRARMEFHKPEVQHDFSAWPDEVDGLRVLDPCCGSGHFLVEAYKALLAMYREQNPDASRAALAVRPLANLFGLELDPRCTQIAAFALALTAWKAGAPHEGLPVPNIACCGLPMGATVDQWKDLASGDAELADVMGELHELFANARDLGSLIDPAAAGMGGLFRMDRARLMPHLERALSRERSAADPASAVFGEAAKGALRALEILRGQYHLVITNLLSQKGDRRSDKRIGCPAAVASADIHNKILKDLFTVRGMIHLRMELNSPG